MTPLECANGGKVLAVRRDDIPGKESVAAILRYAPERREWAGQESNLRPWD